jgi:DNA-binding response OmpR family regulator
MIVDDELDVVRVLKIYLEKKGFQVETFTDANVALQHFRNEFSTFNAHPFDLMVLDIKMPRMNGFELYNKIKEHDSSVNVCFMTALDEFQEYNKYKVEVSPATGKRHFVQKPIRNEQLLDQIISML